jgi:hypothetical protein
LDCLSWLGVLVWPWALRALLGAVRRDLKSGRFTSERVALAVADVEVALLASEPAISPACRRNCRRQQFWSPRLVLERRCRAASTWMTVSAGRRAAVTLQRTAARHGGRQHFLRSELHRSLQIVARPWRCQTAPDAVARRAGRRPSLVWPLDRIC